MLCINQYEIENALSYNQWVDAMEETFISYEKSDFFMPERMHVEHEDGTLLLMPCFGKERFSTKLVSIFPENKKEDLPALYGTVVLNDGKTGRPLALLNGSGVTAMRTAAVGSCGIRHLAPQNAQTLGIIGAGTQAFYQTLFACSQRPVKEVFVYSQNPESIDRFIVRILPLLRGIELHSASSPEEILEKSEIIIAATNSAEPVLPDDPELLQRKCYIGIGSFKSYMREFPEALFRLVDQAFIDTDNAVRESGDLSIPLEKGWLDRQSVHTLGKLIRGEVTPSENSTSLFKSVGMAVFDLVSANLIYQAALEKGVGIEVDL